jgi:hypothetical protein
MRKDYLKWWLQCYNSLFLDFLNDITSSYIMRKGYLKGLLQCYNALFLVFGLFERYNFFTFHEKRLLKMVVTMLQ